MVFAWNVYKQFVQKDLSLILWNYFSNCKYTRSQRKTRLAFLRGRKLRETLDKNFQSHENQQTFPCYDTLYSIQVGVLTDECTKD